MVIRYFLHRKPSGLHAVSQSVTAPSASETEGVSHGVRYSGLDAINDDSRECGSATVIQYAVGFPECDVKVGETEHVFGENVLRVWAEIGCSVPVVV